ncbi:hypothetical protein ACIBQ2_27730 [Micromonospora sediminimaris]|uniref:hypothetical protein n=1 Tax=Micromonospora sediminimaris TaxID=547162 RepID=UPI00378A7B82
MSVRRSDRQGEGGERRRHARCRRGVDSTVALALLGLSWNLGLVSGTAMITDNAPTATRAKTQGTVDLCAALAGAGGGIASGVVMTATSYSTLPIIGGILALAVIPFVATSARQSRTSSAEQQQSSLTVAAGENNIR